MPTSDKGERLEFDLETNGLLADVTRVHCLVIKDRETGEVRSYADQPGYPAIEQGVKRLAAAEQLFAHNGVRFDYPVLEKFYPQYPMRGKLFDTQVMAQARFIHVKETDYKNAKRGAFPGNECGKHRLRAWGYRLGIWKGDYKGGWAEWNEDMQDYCVQDVEVLHALVDLLSAQGLTKQTIEIEHAVARYLFGQERNGWAFNVEGAEKLESTLRTRLAEIEIELIDTFGSWYEQDGKTRVPKQDRTMRKGRLAPTSFVEGRAYDRLKLVEFNPGSRHHIAHVMQRDYGWDPPEYTPSGQPKVDEQTLKGIDAPEAAMAIEYLTVTKRLGQLADGRQAWLKHVEENPITGMPHIHHGCIPGPITHRMRHVSPNLGQVPANYSAYGPECRELFTVPPGWKMLGADVSGLELRILGHHMFQFDEGEYAREAIEGDIHSRNAEALGLDRDRAKIWVYAYLYGAGNKKLGSVAMPDCVDKAKLKARGKRDRGKFERSTPALESVVDRAKAEYDHRGCVVLLDGRPAFPRGAHSALNTKVQGDGAIVCKKWVQLVDEAFTEAFGPQGWGGQWAALGFIHDELQIAVKPEIADAAAELIVSLIPKAGEALGVLIPLAGEATVGTTWKETH